MGVYIKGMKKPKCCLDCWTMNFHAVIGCKIYGEADKVADGCPLVEVKTPHGRLIDVDEHFREIKSHWCAGCVNYPKGCAFCKVTVYEDMMDAPTVIKAEVK